MAPVVVVEEQVEERSALERRWGTQGRHQAVVAEVHALLETMEAEPAAQVLLAV